MVSHKTRVVTVTRVTTVTRGPLLQPNTSVKQVDLLTQCFFWSYCSALFDRNYYPQTTFPTPTNYINYYPSTTYYPPGNYCVAGTEHGKQAPCESGFFCPEGSHEPTPCPAGEYCPSNRLSASAGNCAGGYYCVGGYRDFVKRFFLIHRRILYFLANPSF